MPRVSPSAPGPNILPLSPTRREIPPLPAPLTPILGREAEIAQVSAFLNDPSTRLVTLTGAGGIGKTRLAVEIAARLAPDFAHGAAFVSLADVGELEVIVRVIAQGLGVKAQPGERIEEMIVPTLRQAHLLLVLDNVEHVVDTVAPWLAEVLEKCPRLTVLATSRRALNIAGEQRFAVPPLPLPDAAAIAAVPGNAAVALFTQRAHAVWPDFALSAENAATVAEIVRRLDGVPLAIELAAAQVAMLPPAALLARLSGRLARLSAGRRDAPERHRTMHAAISWSYDLLPPDAQWLFRRLAVFVGGFSLDAAEAVGGDSTMDLLRTLVDHSLVSQMPGTGHEPRFRMLEPIREFALERLIAEGEEAAARDAHAAWCLTLGERTFAVLRGSGRSQWFDLIDIELGNIRAAFAWFDAQDRVEDAVNLAMGVFIVFYTRGYHSEAFALFDAFLRHPRLALRTRTRATALLGHGILVKMRGAVEPALEELHEAVAIFRELDDSVHTGLALTNVGNAYSSLSDFDRAAEAHREVIAIGRETDDAWLLKAALNNLGVVLSARGEVDQAVPLFEETLAMARMTDDVYGIELALQNLADVFLMREDYDRAESLIQEALSVLAGFGHRADLSYAWMKLAQIARARGDSGTATHHLTDALTMARDIDDRAFIGRVLLALGDIARLQGDVAGAMGRFREGIALSRQIGSRADLAVGLEGIAGAAAATGALRQAARLLGAADALLEQIGATRPAGARGADYDHHARAVRQALGEAAFSAAWSEGHDLPPADAVAEALAFDPAPEGVQPTVPAPDTGGLSPREREVLRLLADGLTDQQIADALFISRRTVTNHTSSIFSKLDLPSRTAAVAYAIRHGLA